MPRFRHKTFSAFPSPLSQFQTLWGWDSGKPQVLSIEEGGDASGGIPFPKPVPQLRVMLVESFPSCVWHRKFSMGASFFFFFLRAHFAL